VLSDLYSDTQNATPVQPGFLARDILRFIAVDIILMAFLKLFLGMGFFAGPGEYIAGILIGKLLLLAYLVWLIRHRPDGWTATGIAAGGRWRGWFVAAGLYAAYYLASPHINTINHLLMIRLYGCLGWQYEALPQDVMLLIFGNALQQPIRLLLIGFTIVAGPFMEELAFRGMGYDAYRRTGGVAVAIIWTGLLFGIFHFRVDLVLPLGLLGMVFGVARAASRTLWCPILIHCFHNGLVLWEMARELSLR
jgi:membrane protease YdiL (CAAX protease family)